MKIECLLDFTLKAGTIHEYSENNGIWLVTQFENHGKSRESEVYLRHVTEASNDDARCNKG